MGDAPLKTYKLDTKKTEKKATIERTKTTRRCQSSSPTIKGIKWGVDHSRVNGSVVVLFSADRVLRKSRERLSFCIESEGIC